MNYSSILRNDLYQRKNDIYFEILGFYGDYDTYEELYKLLHKACNSAGFNLPLHFDCDLYSKRAYKKLVKKRDELSKYDIEEVFLYETFQTISESSILFNGTLFPLNNRNANILIRSLEEIKIAQRETYNLN